MIKKLRNDPTYLSLQPYPYASSNPTGIAMPEGSYPVPQAILFDLDNTLCTFVDAKITACNAVVQAVGAGNGEDLLSYFLRPVHNFEDHIHIIEYFTDLGVWNGTMEIDAGKIYDQTKLDTITLYPGVRTTLDRLKDAGIKIAVVTDAHSTNARLRMQKLGILDDFPVLITPDISGKRKPEHASFLLAMKQLHTTAQETWVVGDSLRREVAPGREIGMTTVFARYGDWIGIDIPDVIPDLVLDQFSDLIDLTGLADTLTD